MKAAVVEKPGVLVVIDLPPPQIGDYDALVQMLYGATCTGTDQHLIYGRFPWPIKYPTILGHESIGRVIELGRKVRHYKKGDLVTRVGTPAPPGGEYTVSWGGFAELGIARDHRAMKEDGIDGWRSSRINQVLPPDSDPAASTMIITWRETLSYITRMGVRRGCSILISGSGGNGLGFAAHAANLGARLVAMAGSEARQDAARAAGATDYFDYRQPDLAGALARCCPEGFDFIIDAVGKAGTIDALLPLLKPEGMVGIYGIDDYNAVSLNPRKAKGTFTYNGRGYDEPETHDAVMLFIRKGLLKAEVWMDLKRPFALSDINLAFQTVAQRKAIKALVKLS